MAKKVKLKPKQDAPTIAVSLRQWRKAKGWTRRQAAEYLEVNARTLESWEYGYRTPPSLNLLDKLWVNKRKFG